MNHSPLPWKAVRTLIRAEGNVLIAAAEWADVEVSVAFDNAAYIDWACNNCEALLEACRAALLYDEAIEQCGNDPDRMNSYCTAEGETLDSLYAQWLSKARAAIAAATPEPEKA